MGRASALCVALSATPAYGRPGTRGRRCPVAGSGPFAVCAAGGVSGPGGPSRRRARRFGARAPRRLVCACPRGVAASLVWSCASFLCLGRAFSGGSPPGRPSASASPFSPLVRPGAPGRPRFASGLPSPGLPSLLPPGGGAASLRGPRGGRLLRLSPPPRARRGKRGRRTFIFKALFRQD